VKRIEKELKKSKKEEKAEKADASVWISESAD
jgi:hypothetical protein